MSMPNKAVLLLVSMLACLPVYGGGYRTSVGTGADEIPVVVVYGTPHEMGRAQGQLLRDELAQCLERFVGAAVASGVELLQPPNLDRAWGVVAPHTDPRFVEELEGLAVGAGVPLEMLRRMHMIPVVAEYACSGVAVWGSMTKDGHLYQLRNLDYKTEVGLQDYPVIVVYVPDKGLPHVNVTFAGVIGANTGINSEGIVLGEKGEAPPEDSPFDIDGTHFFSMFRTVLYDAHSLKEAIGIMRDTRRIKKYYWYVGDGQIPAAVKIRAYAPNMLIWGGGDSKDELVPNIVPDAVYNTMENDKAFETLTRHKGAFDSQRMIALSREVASKDGSLLNVVYDATQLKLWVAYAEKDEMASSRTYVPVDAKPLFDKTRVPEGAVVVKGDV